MGQAVAMTRAAAQVLPERLLASPLPGVMYGGWLALAHRRGRLTPEQLIAGIDIVRGLDRYPAAASGLRAVDPSRLVVDGGRVEVPLHPAGGKSVQTDSQRRVTEWHGLIRARPLSLAVLRGRQNSLYVDLLMVRVLVHGEGCKPLEGWLGVRRGRVDELVRKELAAYAEHFCLVQNFTP